MWKQYGIGIASHEDPNNDKLMYFSKPIGENKMEIKLTKKEIANVEKELEEDKRKAALRCFKDTLNDLNSRIKKAENDLKRAKEHKEIYIRNALKGMEP